MSVWHVLLIGKVVRNKRNTVKSVLEAAASNNFDVIFGQNLLSKK